MRRERTNSSGETVGTGQLRCDECGNVTSSFVILGVTGFGDSCGGDHRSRQGENQHAYFQGYQHDRRPTGSLKWHCWKVRRHETRHFGGVLAIDVRGTLKVGKEPIGSP